MTSLCTISFTLRSAATATLASRRSVLLATPTQPPANRRVTTLPQAAPAPGAQIRPDQTIVLTFNKTVASALGHSRPVVTPANAGSWTTVNDHTIEFRPSGDGYGLAGAVAGDCFLSREFARILPGVHFDLRLQRPVAAGRQRQERFAGVEHLACQSALLFELAHHAE